MKLDEVRRLVGKVRTRLFKKANAEAVGSLKSHFRGTGLQFKEHQVYNAGDDVRFIDWKLLAKMNTPYIKTFEEERNVEIVIVVDCSPSMRMGYKSVTKLQAALEIVFLFYLLAEATKDIVSVILIDQEIETIPGAAGERGISNLLRVLEKKEIINVDGKVIVDADNLNRQASEKKLGIVLRHLQRKREVVIVSDYLDFFESQDIDKLAWNKNAHFYKVCTPFDLAESHPFSITAQRGGDQVSGKVYFKKNMNPSKGHRVKEIHLDRPYLDEFVRELR